MERCSSCNVPLMIGQGHRWESNGAITLAGSPQNRIVFYESEWIDPVFRGIEEIIKVPIEHIVIESRARETRRYIGMAFPGQEEHYRRAVEGASEEERKESREHIRSITRSIIEVGRMYGYGDTRMSPLWESGHPFPWRVQVVREPYSLLFTVADNLGSVEATEGRDMWAGYQELGENLYRIEVYEGEHPVGLKERLRRRRYGLKPGDIEYRRCPECGIPMEVSRYEWDPDRGLIVEPSSGRRMAMFGHLSVDAIFDDLEEELGDVIPRTVIESMRRYSRRAFAEEEWRRDMDSFRNIISLRGLGNLTRFEGDRTHLAVTIENAVLPLPIVGSIQALVELAYRVDSSTVEWELGEDGDLRVDVRVSL